MSTPQRHNQFDRPANAAGVARRDRGQRGLRRATILTVAGAAVVTVIGTSLASQAVTHSHHQSSGTVASSAAAIAAAQQAQSNQAAASNSSASASVPSASVPTASQSQPVASSGGS